MSGEFYDQYVREVEAERDQLRSALSSSRAECEELRKENERLREALRESCDLVQLLRDTHEPEDSDDFAEDLDCARGYRERAVDRANELRKVGQQ